MQIRSNQPNGLPKLWDAVQNTYLDTDIIHACFNLITFKIWNEMCLGPLIFLSGMFHRRKTKN